MDENEHKKGVAVRNMFAGIAHRYDFLNHLLSFNRDRAWRRLAVKLSGVAADSRVLDICCGTGDLALEFRSKVSDAGAVVGSDFTPEMIALACQKARARKVKVPFLVADALCLPFPNASFSICSVAFGIRNVQNPAAGIAEMARVVRPGGRVVILEFARYRSRIMDRLTSFYMNRLMPWIGQKVSRSRERAYHYLPESITLFPEPQKVSKIMEECGLVEVSYKLKTFGIVAVHTGVRPVESVAENA